MPSTSGPRPTPAAARRPSPDGGNGSTGGLIDSQAAVGGWPELTATADQIARAAVDTDGDGIPDYYEELLGLDPKDASDAVATTLDPQKLYSNIEVYFHYLVRDVTLSQVKGGSYTAFTIVDPVAAGGRREVAAPPARRLKRCLR